LALSALYFFFIVLISCRNCSSRQFRTLLFVNFPYPLSSQMLYSSTTCATLLKMPRFDGLLWV
jgi:hypothetical protein